MGRPKRVQSPHRKNSLNKSFDAKSIPRRISLLTLVSPDDVTEATLEVWRSLPSKIRCDPSLAPFQAEHERVNGIATASHFSVTLELIAAHFVFVFLGSGSFEAGPSNEQDEQEEFVNNPENDEHLIQLQISNADVPLNRLDCIRYERTICHDLNTIFTMQNVFT